MVVTGAHHNQDGRNRGIITTRMVVTGAHHNQDGRNRGIITTRMEEQGRPNQDGCNRGSCVTNGLDVIKKHLHNQHGHNHGKDEGCDTDFKAKCFNFNK
jgi:hypothetical protein